MALDGAVLFAYSVWHDLVFCMDGWMLVGVYIALPFFVLLLRVLDWEMGVCLHSYVLRFALVLLVTCFEGGCP